jgi:cell division transport system permease protein
VVTVSYTVRLTLYARREMIRVLKLVGAADAFVMAPFLLEGVIHGAIAIGISLFLLYLGYRVVDVRVPQAVFLSWGMVGSFAAFGVVISVLGSWVSVRVFLKTKG